MKWPRYATVMVLAVALVLAMGVIVWLGAQRFIATRSGPAVYAPEDAEWLLSEQAKKLVASAYAGLGDHAVVQDYWVHILSLGQRDAGQVENRSFLNPAWLTWWNPLQRLHMQVLLSASGVTDSHQADAQYLARLLRLARALPHKHELHIIALDQRYTPDGRPRPDASFMAVDSDYVWALAQGHPDLFEPVVSVHPARKNAVEALAHWASRGVHAVAWMPMLQGIDPASDQLTAYYQALIEHDMTLYTRTGAASVFASTRPEYGNPMRYRAALEAGVHIVMMHISGQRRFRTPDGEGRATGTQLLLRLLRNPEYDDNLYVALGGVVGDERAQGSLMAWLQHPQVTEQLVYASAYPRPAIDALVDLAALADAGFLTKDQVQALREIRTVNPLLFDFVLMRTIRLPYTDLGLPSEVFIREIGVAETKTGGG